MMSEPMKRQAVYLQTLLLATVVMSAAFRLEAAEVTNQISLAGNGWMINPEPGNHDVISHNRPMTWTNPKSIIRTYFKTMSPGDLQLALRAKVERGVSKIRLTFDGKSKIITLANKAFELIPFDTVQNLSPGYHALDMQGIEKQGRCFAEVSDLLVVGFGAPIYYVKDEYYWGRRGPSVHLNLIPPKDAGDVLYYYNEITVPDSNDVIGSYYMANGFSGGYFGIQANSPTERRILFSVWSPYHTNNPKEIPEDSRVKLLRKGAEVHGGEFGGEGSGGQSYRRYFWKTGVTYKFLLKGEPAENQSTDFTAWFFAPEIGTWELMASFRKPKGAGYLKHPHAFLENFNPATGYLPRSVFYSKQWLYSTDQTWREITEFAFSCDNTGHKKNRLDFTGGTDGTRFFLKNCGFFDADVKPGTRFTRKPSGRPPVIDFSKLP